MATKIQVGDKEKTFLPLIKLHHRLFTVALNLKHQIRAIPLTPQPQHRYINTPAGCKDNGGDPTRNLTMPLPLLHLTKWCSSSSSSSSLKLKLFLCLQLLLHLPAANAAVKIPPGYSVPAVFVFGDSIVDTGNNNNLLTQAKCNYPPYGKDLPGGQATGRFSNGRVPSDLVGINKYFLTRNF